MSRKFISLVLAASLAVAGFSAAPARAGNNDVAKVLAGLAAVAVIGAVIHENKKDRARVSSRNHGYDPYYAQRPYRAQPPAYHHGQQRRHYQAERAYERGYNDHRRAVQQRRSDHHHARKHSRHHNHSAYSRR